MGRQGRAVCWASLCETCGPASPFPSEPFGLRVLLLLDGLRPRGQAPGAGGQQHDEDAHQEGDQRPEEAVQEDGLVVGALQHDIVRPATGRYENLPDVTTGGKHLPRK